MISTNRPNDLLGPWINALIGGVQPLHGWWAPVAQHYKKRCGDQGSKDEVDRSCRDPPTENLTRYKESAASDGKTH